jgi:hypothetical protein
MVPVPDDSWFSFILPVIVILIVLAGFILVYYLLKKYKRQPEDTTPELNAIPAPQVTSPDATVSRTAFTTQDSHVCAQYSDINQNTLAIRQKYSLDSLTIASSDGLVVVSSGNPSAETDAAYFAQYIVTGHEIVKDGVNVETIEFRGSPLLIIIKSNAMLSVDQVDTIKNDVRKVLRDWL